VIGLLVLLNLAWLNLWIQLSPIGFLETQSRTRIICIIYRVFSNSRNLLNLVLEIMGLFLNAPILLVVTYHGSGTTRGGIAFKMSGMCEKISVRETLPWSELGRR
jgi:hypothetical protein